MPIIMPFTFRCYVPSARWRGYSTFLKPPIRLVAELRKLTDVSLSKAREALVATNNDIEAAAAWLKMDLASSGAQKLAKLESRLANEGVIAISILSPGLGQSVGGFTRAAMVELNCESDFVSRNVLLRNLAANVAHSAAFLAEPGVSEGQQFQNYQINQFIDAPLITSDQAEARKTSESVNDHIRHTVAKVGEKITLRRAIAIARESIISNTGFRVASYIHGALPDNPKVGNVGALVDIRLKSQNLSPFSRKYDFGVNLSTLERALARQIVGFNAIRTRSSATENEVSSADEVSKSLYSQQFLMHPSLSSETVESALSGWSEQEGLETVQVNSFVRWTVGEEIIADLD